MEAPPAKPKLVGQGPLAQLCHKTHPAFGGFGSVGAALTLEPPNRLHRQHLQEFFALGFKDGKLVDVVRAKGALGHDGGDAKRLKAGSRALVGEACKRVKMRCSRMKWGKRTDATMVLVCSYMSKSS